MVKRTLPIISCSEKQGILKSFNITSSRAIKFACGSCILIVADFDKFKKLLYPVLIALNGMLKHP
jgi:hypothetical protein